MTNDPRRMIHDPLLGPTILDWASEEGTPEPLSDEARQAVGALIAASAAGVLSAGAAASAAAQSGGTAVATSAAGVGGIALAKTIGVVLLAASITAGGLAVVMGPDALAGWFSASNNPAEQSQSISEHLTTPAPHEAAPPAAPLPNMDAADEAGDPSPSAVAEAAHQVNKPNQSQKPHTAAASDTSANAVPSPSAQTRTLAEEVALLREVRRVLSTDPEAAQKLLQEYQERHPSGALQAEYEALAARARAQQGAAE